MYEFDGLGKSARRPRPRRATSSPLAASATSPSAIPSARPDCVEPLPFVKISAPTVEMTFSVNDSPFAGREGKFVTSRQLRDRLFRETLKDVSLRVSEIEGARTPSTWRAAARCSLSILIETMRREGYEFQVSPPRVLYQDDRRQEVRAHRAPGGGRARRVRGRGHREAGRPQGRSAGDDPRRQPHEGWSSWFPPAACSATATSSSPTPRARASWPACSTATRPTRARSTRRNTGSLIAFETGESITYGLFNAQERGALFIGARRAGVRGHGRGRQPQAGGHRRSTSARRSS